MIPSQKTLDSVSRAAFLSNFRSLAQKRALTPAHMALRAVALGQPLNRAFTPVTNRIKLGAGQRPWGGLARALQSAFLLDLASIGISNPECVAHTEAQLRLMMRASQSADWAPADVPGIDSTRQVPVAKSSETPQTSPQTSPQAHPAATPL